MNASAERSRPAAAMAAAVLVLVALLAALGAVLAFGALSADDGPPPRAAGTPAHSGPYAIGDVVPTSFGVISADHVERTPGPTAKALSGVTHGISRLVTPDRAQVQVTVTVTNLRRRATLPYSPLQFTASDGTGRVLRPVGATMRPGVLQPGASIQGRIAFVVPRNGRHLTLRFDDPARRTPLRVHLGRTGRAAPAPTGGHSHGGTNR